MSYCLYCNRKGHASYECWSKNKYLKEIRRNENGKLTKRYGPNYSTSCTSIINSSDFDENERQQPKQTSRTRTAAPKTIKLKANLVQKHTKYS